MYKLHGVKEIVLNEKYDWRLRLEWKVLNQSSSENTTNIYFHYKFIANKEAFGCKWAKYRFNLKAKNASGGYTTILNESEYYTEDDNEFSAWGEETILSMSENVKHYSGGDTIITFGCSFNYQLFVGDPGGGQLEDTATIPAVSSGASMINTSDFTDEQNLSVDYVYDIDEDFQTVQVGIALDDDNSYQNWVVERDVPLNGSQYTIEFTEAERDLLREATPGSSRTVYVLARGKYADGTYSSIYYSLDCERTFYIQGVAPSLSPEVRDINPKTVALTGDENVIVRGKSILAYKFNAVASKKATIEYYEMGFGNLAYEDISEEGTINVPNIDDFNALSFYVRDSRNMTTYKTVGWYSGCDYTKLTCNQKVDIEMVDQQNGQVHLVVSGNYFNGSFGAADNELKIYVRHTQNNGEMGDYIELTDGLIPVFDGNTYTLDITISGFGYRLGYDFQCKVEDKLSVVETELYRARITPVYDWSETDFNFNVPVAIQQDLDVKGNVNIGGELTVQDGVVDRYYILSDATTSGEINLNIRLLDYKFLEIYYTDTNNRGCGVCKVPIDMEEGKAKTVDLSLVEASSATRTYIRRTAYIISAATNGLHPNIETAGYVFINGSSISHTTGTNHLQITKILGYK